MPLSEPILDTTLSINDGNITINEYSLKRTNHSNNIKQIGVFMHLERYLPLIKRKEYKEVPSNRNTTILILLRLMGNVQNGVLLIKIIASSELDKSKYSIK